MCEWERGQGTPSHVPCVYCLCVYVWSVMQLLCAGGCVVSWCDLLPVPLRKKGMFCTECDMMDRFSMFPLPLAPAIWS